MTDLLVRDSTEADVPAIRDIYAHHVLTGTGSFEETPPTVAEMADRRAALLKGGYPFLVAVDPADTVLGFAYGGPLRPRSAFRHTVEDSIYVAPEAQGKGVGRRLLTALVERCTALGFRQMVALVGDSANTGSQELHRRLGFTTKGTIDEVGQKFGRWLDVVIMQRALGDSSDTPETR